MKELNLTEEQKKLLNGRKFANTTATFLSEINLFKLTDSDGDVRYYTADLSKCTGYISGEHSTKVVDGELQITPLSATITLKNN